MLRYLLAPTHAPFADALGIARTLDFAGGHDSVSGRARPLTSPVATADGADPAEAIQSAGSGAERGAEGRPAGAAGAGAGHARPAPAAIAITFDDGPHPRGTPEILDILARHGAKATFFVVGEQVLQRPQLLVRMRDEGHGIALHGFHHRLHLRRSPREMEDDFTRGLAAIQDAVGITPTRHRPPFGIYSPWSLRIARDRGLEPLLWSAWGKDWRRYTTAGRIARHACERAKTPPLPPFEPLRSGDVILLHDADFYSSAGAHVKTASALPKVLSTLKSGGFDTVIAV